MGEHKKERSTVNQNVIKIHQLTLFNMMNDTGSTNEGKEIGGVIKKLVEDAGEILKICHQMGYWPIIKNKEKKSCK